MTTDEIRVMATRNKELDANSKAIQSKLAKKKTHEPIIVTAVAPIVKEEVEIIYPDRDVWMSTELTVEDINVPAQMFSIAGKMWFFWLDPDLDKKVKLKKPRWNIEDDGTSLPIGKTDVIENCASPIMMMSPVKFDYNKKTAVVTMTYHFQCDCHERMELHAFPIDRQFLNLEMCCRMSGEGGWNWLGEAPRWVDKKYEVALKTRLAPSVSEYSPATPWVDYAGEEVKLRIRVERIGTYFFGQIILPVFLLVLSCFSVFAIEAESPADRLSVSVTLLLALVAFEYVISEMLPKNPYLTYMDYYIMSAFLVMFIFIVHNAAAGWLANRENFDIQLFDFIFMAVLGVFWLIVNTISALSVKCGYCRKSWEDMHVADEADDPDTFILAEDENVVGEAPQQISQEFREKLQKRHEERRRAQMAENGFDDAAAKAASAEPEEPPEEVGDGDSDGSGSGSGSRSGSGSGSDEESEDEYD